MMLLEGYSQKTVLLLQGPVGPYFRRLARELGAAGARVIKVNFNGGDVLFYRRGLRYRGKLADIPGFVAKLIERERVDILMLCGDCRPVHAGMAGLAQRLRIELKVFEEGYLRPDFITCESMGVNGHSSVPRDPCAYRQEPHAMEADIRPVGRTYWHMVLWTLLYYMACHMAWPLFPKYVHHRTLSPLEGLRWCRGVWRKWYYRCVGCGVQTDLCLNHSQRFYVVPLQVHNDAQVRAHSPFETVERFIDEVIESFARHAPLGTLLVLKHHPMDRAYRDFRGQIRRLANRHGIAARVRYIHDQHLPTLYKHARGAVVINSTAGLTAVHRGVPTKVMGDAIFDMPGLTWQGPLDTFWGAQEAAAVDRDLYLRFRGYLIRTCQINTSFYRGGLPSVCRSPERAVAVIEI
ncbi:MAG: capsular polysaccharide export protein [Paraburkholderia sp.]|nr:capsular polysaccharide export protein [Paraburkholderia sp.]